MVKTKDLLDHAPINQRAMDKEIPQNNTICLISMLENEHSDAWRLFFVRFATVCHPLWFIYGLTVLHSIVDTDLDFFLFVYVDMM